MKHKTIKFDKALSLDKEVITQLNEEQLGTLGGGQAFSQTCNPAIAVGDEGFPVTCSCNACSC